MNVITCRSPARFIGCAAPLPPSARVRPPLPPRARVRPKSPPEPLFGASRFHFLPCGQQNQLCLSRMMSWEAIQLCCEEHLCQVHAHCICICLPCMTLQSADLCYVSPYLTALRTTAHVHLLFWGCLTLRHNLCSLNRTPNVPTTRTPNVPTRTYYQTLHRFCATHPERLLHAQ